MSLSVYRYSIPGVFPFRKVDLPRLMKEIQVAQNITTGLFGCDISDNDVVFSFKHPLEHSELLALEVVIAAHSGEALPEAKGPTTADLRPKVVVEKPNSPKFTTASHDWTDPSTWYTESVRIGSELASPTGDPHIYQLSCHPVIDSYHGLLWQERFLKDSDGYDYRVRISVDGAPKTERDPHFGDMIDWGPQRGRRNGDYTIDYMNGTIHFVDAFPPTAAVVVSYHYATTSGFIVRPPVGRTLVIDAAEAQFSDDIEMHDSIFFQGYGPVDIFAPQLVAAGIIPSGTNIPLGATGDPSNQDPLIYQTITDIQADALRSYPMYPRLGSNWRGCPRPAAVFDFDYVSAIELHGNLGMYLRMSLEHDKPFGGWFCTTTFYCKIVRDDVGA